MDAENAEKNLWDQIRSVTQVQMRVIQGGITILSALLMAIAFYRKDMSDVMGYDNKLPYPFSHWIIGFLLLIIVAFIFYNISLWVRKRLFYYIEALRNLPKEYPDDNVKIYPEIPKDTSVINFTRLIFWVFPSIDFVIYTVKWIAYIVVKNT